MTNLKNKFKGLVHLNKSLSEYIDINGSFEQGWDTLPTYPGTTLRNQQPNKWGLYIVPPGSKMYDSNDEASGVPECVHKLCSQLPQNECVDGEDAIILDGETVYKIFSATESFGAALLQTVTGIKKGSQCVLTAPVRVHNPSGSEDAYAAEVWVGINGHGSWHNLEELPHREYTNIKFEHVHALTMDEAVLEIRVKSKWKIPFDFFLDDITFEVDGYEEEIPPPVDKDLEERVTLLELRVAALEESIGGL